MEFDTLNEGHPPAGEEFDLDGLVLVGGARLDLGALREMPGVVIGH